MKRSVAADVQLQKSVTGELIAYDTKQKKIIATGFDDEEDFQQWLINEKNTDRD